MGKKLGLDKAYSNLLTTVNKNSPTNLNRVFKTIGVYPNLSGKGLSTNTPLSNRPTIKTKDSGVLKKVTQSIFKRSPIGRIIDAGVKIGAGVGAGYSYAKEKFKPDNKMGGGMAKKYSVGGGADTGKRGEAKSKATIQNMRLERAFPLTAILAYKSGLTKKTSLPIKGKHNKMGGGMAENRGMGLQDESMKPGKIMKAKYGKEAKIKKVMKEFKKGELHIGKSKKKVKNKKQAIAIALSEARKGKA
jgi:hypothetical protein